MSLNLNVCGHRALRMCFFCLFLSICFSFLCFALLSALSSFFFDLFVIFLHPLAKKHPNEKSKVRWSYDGGQQPKVSIEQGATC